MAGDWIKIEKATSKKPEILRIASDLGVSRQHAFGLCFDFWAWCDDNLTDGHASGVTDVTLDSVIGHAGFTDALIKAGWILSRNGSIEVANFDRHLSQSAKNRGLASDRQRKKRSRSKRDESVTREEKRRCTDNTLTKGASEGGVDRPKRDAIPAIDDVKRYARSAPVPISEECAVGFHDASEARGWVDRQGLPIANWQAALRRWATQWNANEARQPAARGSTRNPSAAAHAGYDEKITLD